MKIIIRADASVFIGSGHIMRTLVFAKILNKNGHDVTFATRPQKGDFIKFINDNGFPVIKLKEPLCNVEPIDSSDYIAWLQVPCIEDANDFLEKIKKADLVIVDHYGIDSAWEIYT